MSNTINKKCIVTGACGFIGSHLSEMLIDLGHTVYGVDDLSTGSVDNVSNLNKDRFHLVHTSILSGAFPKIETIDWFFHLAARADVVPSIEWPELYHDVNVTGTVRMLELARRLKAKKFIYTASSSCYGDNPNTPTKEEYPINTKYPYALTKYLGEECALHWGKVYGFDVASLRLFNVYGPRARTNGTYGAVMGVFLSQLANSRPLTIVGDGRQARDFTHVKDVAKAFVDMAKSSATGIFNVGSNRPQSINYLASRLGRNSEIKGQIEFVPDRPGEPRITHADISKIFRKIGWAPHISFEDGVNEMLINMSKFKDAPLWDKQSIAKATESWFKYLS